MYGATVLKDSKSGWRGKKKTGGGCLYEFASHGIDLALYLFGPPRKVAGSLLQSIYSSQVEDYVSSTFIYDNGCTGSIAVNWSDETFRKPANIMTINGTRGKIIADKHAYKVYLKDDDPIGKLKKGWNTFILRNLPKASVFTSGAMNLLGNWIILLIAFVAMKTAICAVLPMHWKPMWSWT
jgi:scyllo-inositol 2-dehydrogenase (NADP+)